MLSTDEQLLCRPRVLVNLPLGDSTSQPIQFGMNIEARVIAVALVSSARGVMCGADGLTSYERDQRGGVDCDSGHIGLCLCPPSSVYMSQCKMIVQRAKLRWGGRWELYHEYGVDRNGGQSWAA